MNEPSAISGVLGFAVLFAVVLVIGLLVEWVCETWEGSGSEKRRR